MSNPIIKIHNAETGEITEREMTDAEFAKHQSEQLAAQNAEAERFAAKAAAEAKLAALGLTADNLKALGL